MLDVVTEIVRQEDLKISKGANWKLLNYEKSDLERLSELVVESGVVAESLKSGYKGDLEESLIKLAAASIYWLEYLRLLEVDDGF